MESISQTTAPSAPVSSATPTASVPDSASQFATNSPSSFQAQAPVMPQAPVTSPASSGPAGFGQQSVAGSIPGAQRKPEFAASVPSPGTILGVSNTNTSGQYPGSAGFSAPGSGMGKPGDADLRSPSFNPNLFGPGGGVSVPASS